MDIITAGPVVGTGAIIMITTIRTFIVITTIIQDLTDTGTEGSHSNNCVTFVDLIAGSSR
jgi:hypothetical protein